MFQFKHFTVHDELCAMKVGTDGVLIGAWADVEDASRILDIGTGSGLIALMLAQRSAKAEILGVDVDADAVRQATLNFNASLWSGRLSAVECDVRGLEGSARFDHIVTNPPYFVETTESPNASRAVARHASHLHFGDIVAVAERLLVDGGKLSVILPSDVAAQFRREAFEHLWLSRQTDVVTKPGEAPCRTMMEFRKTPHPLNPHCDILAIGSSRYREIVKDFYLNM